MHLRDMTREQLWALDEDEIKELCKLHGIDMILTSVNPLSKMNSYKFRGWGCILADLEHLRLELQQDNADSRRETQEELTVDEEKQLKYDYAKASAKINPQDR